MKFFAMYVDHTAHEVHYYPTLNLKTKRGILNRLKSYHLDRNDGTQNYCVYQLKSIFDETLNEVKEFMRDLYPNYEKITCLEF